MRSFPPVPLGSPGQCHAPTGAEISQLAQDAESIGRVIVSSTTAIQLKSTDPRIIIITGSANQQIRLPPESTLLKGTMFRLINRGTGTLSIRSSANSVINILVASSGATSMPTMDAVLQDPTLTSNSAWAGFVLQTSYGLGKSLTINRIMTLDGADNQTYTFPATGCLVAAKDLDNAFAVDQTFTARIIAQGVIRRKGYTVATLPAGTQGDGAFVTNALGPVYAAAVVGGGAIVTPVFYDGTNWTCR